MLMREVKNDVISVVRFGFYDEFNHVTCHTIVTAQDNRNGSYYVMYGNPDNRARNVWVVPGTEVNI